MTGNDEVTLEGNHIEYYFMLDVDCIVTLIGSLCAIYGEKM